MKLTKLENSLSLTFKDKGLLLKALTHSSHAYENQPGHIEDNELLEFLGDSVVGMIVAEFFYRAYPDLGEGELSKLKSSAASTLALSDLAKKIHLDKAILLGKGEEKSGGRKKRTILAGAFEALVGAVYLDAGFETARDFVIRLIAGSVKPIRSDSFEINNYKSALQEMCQREALPSPAYRTLMEKGPDHKKTFVVEVSIGRLSLAKATGSSKKNAEQHAAQKALKAVLGRHMKVLSEEAFIVEKK